MSNRLDRTQFEERCFLDLQDKFIDKNTELWNKFVEEEFELYEQNYQERVELEVEDYLLEQSRDSEVEDGN